MTNNFKDGIMSENDPQNPQNNLSTQNNAQKTKPLWKISFEVD